MKFKIVGWKAMRTGSLYGFASVLFDDYLKVDQIAIRDGKRGLWAGLPSRQWTDRQGKAHYDPVVSFADKQAAYRFSDVLITRLSEKHPGDLPALEVAERDLSAHHAIAL